MIHGESRFFNNWQMPREISSDLMLAEAEDTNEIINSWLETTGIYNKF